MAITNYWSGHTVESAKKERERLRKKYAKGSEPRKAENLDNKEETYPLGSNPVKEGPDSAMFETIRQSTDVRKRKK